MNDLLADFCDDEIHNEWEEDTDCGGPCDACPTCEDGIKNQEETGVDCGGPCTKPCHGMKNIPQWYAYTENINIFNLQINFNCPLFSQIFHSVP